MGRALEGSGDVRHHPRLLRCEGEQHAREAVVTTLHAREHLGKALFLSRKVWRVDDRGVLHGEVEVEVASDIPEPARIGLSMHLARPPEVVHWLGLGPHENYPDRKLAAQQGRWTLPLQAMHTPYIFRRKTACGAIPVNWCWGRIS